MERRKFLGAFGMGAASIGALGASVPGAEPLGLPTDRNSVRAADFGASGNGTADDSAAIQKAIDAANAMGGGTVFLEGSQGRTFRCGSPLNLDDKRGVRLAGNSGPNVALPDSQSASRLVFTGRSGPFISLRSAHSISFDGLTISYSDPGFRGSLVATGHSPTGKADSGYLLFDRCRFSGLGRAVSAESLLDLGFTICSTVRNCEFQSGLVGVVGTGGAGTYCNAIQITDCTFRDIGRIPIKNGGESWLISGCAFEPLSDGTGAAYKQELKSGAWGLVVIGCWMGDIAKPGGCWLDIQGPVLGLSIIGNRMAAPGTGPKDSAIKIGAGSQGVHISGNRIEGAVGIDFTVGYTFGAAIVGNDLQCKLPLAHLENAMNHFVAGHYTTPNVFSGHSTFQTSTFTGDGGVRGSINLYPQAYMPTTPEDGDVWVTQNDMYVRINGRVRKVTLT